MDKPVPSGLEFVRARIANKHHAAVSTVFWRRASIYAVIPAVLLTSAWVYVQERNHYLHKLEHPQEEFVEYDYRNIRASKYPWGDGEKTLFWNDKYNHL